MRSIYLLIITLVTLHLHAQDVYIPDANFKAYLVGNSEINTNLDAEIQVNEAVAYTGIIFCDNRNISDLTGIESFTFLTQLNCSYNQLSFLDISQNTALTYLNCDENQLSALNVSQNSQLLVLSLSNNQIISLDVSINTALLFLYCNSNLLTSLDVTNNVGLSELACNSNQLECLNIKNGQNYKLYSFNGYFNADFNPNLTCIEVDNAAMSASNWTVEDGEIGDQMYFSEACDMPCILELTSLVPSPKQLLKIVDLMGRETTYKSNAVLIYVFSDQSTQRVFNFTN